MTSDGSNEASGKRLATPWVFFDTEAYRASGLDWSSRSWRSLVELAQSGIVRPVTTSVTNREVGRRIAEALREAEAATSKHHAVLRQLRKGDPLGKGSSEKREKRLRKGFRALREAARFTKIPISAKSGDVLDDYFAGRPPFSARKKSEFPDAFVLRSLQTWAASNSTSLYVVSRDPDVIAFCETEERFIHLNKLPDLLSLALAHDALVRALDDHVRADASLLEGVRRKLNGYRAARAVGGVEVQNIEFEDLEIATVLLIDEDKSNREFLVEVELEATVSVQAYETGLEMIVNRHGNQDMEMVLRRGQASATPNPTAECTITDDGSGAKGAYRTTDWYFSPSEIELDLPRDFKARKIRLQHR